MRGGDGTSTQPHGTASNQGRKAPGEGEVKEPTRTERPPSAPQLQGVIATVSEGDRDTATLCLSQDASGSDCRDYKSAQMTESWKSEAGDRKSTQSLVLSSVQGTAPYGKYEVGTHRSQGN